MPYGLLTRRPATCRRVFVLCHALCVLFFTFYLFSVRPALSSPDGWAATYGGTRDDKAYSIQQARDGGYVVAGETLSFGAGGRDVWVLKLKPDGTVEWQKAYGGIEHNWADSIQQADNGYIVAGYTSSFSDGDFWVLKLRPDGTVEWQKTYGRAAGDWPMSIQQTSDGGYIVAGQTGSGKEGYDIWVLRLRANGTIEWQKVYGEAWDEGADSIQQTTDGGYVVAGSTRSFGAGAYDFWVLKLMADGGIEWQKTYGGDYDEWPGSIQQTRDGGYIVAGMTTSFFGDGPWVLKLRPDGTVEWEKTYGEAGGGSYSIQQTNDGGYIMAGHTDSLNKEGEDVWVLKLRSDGTVEWQKTYGGVRHDRANSIQQTRDGGYILTGCTNSFGAGEKDVWVLKLGADGSIGPSCDFIRDTRVSGRDSNATVKTTTVSPRDSNAVPRDPSATIQATNVSANIQCRSTP